MRLPCRNYITAQTGMVGIAEQACQGSTPPCSTSMFFSWSRRAKRHLDGWTAGRRAGNWQGPETITRQKGAGAAENSQGPSRWWCVLTEELDGYLPGDDLNTLRAYWLYIVPDMRSRHVGQIETVPLPGFAMAAT